jgi:hypothetical protein
MTGIGIVGHRFLQPPAADFVAQQCHALLMELQAECGKITAYSAIAEGADSIFAAAALALQIPLDIVLPFTGYENDFENEAARAMYQQLQQAATRKTILPFTGRSVDAYYEAMQWVLERSAIVIAVWNGDNSGGRAGTADAVKKIRDAGRSWIHIDINNYTTSRFMSDSHRVYKL